MFNKRWLQYNKKLIINGEYINGVLKEKEYYNVGNLKFEGEYSNGYIWNGI